MKTNDLESLTAHLAEILWFHCDNSVIRFYLNASNIKKQRYLTIAKEAIAKAQAIEAA